MESFMNFTIAAVLNIKILFWNPVEPTKQIVNMASITEHIFLHLFQCDSNSIKNLQKLIIFIQVVNYFLMKFQVHIKNRYKKVVLPV